MAGKQNPHSGGVVVMELAVRVSGDADSLPFFLFHLEGW